MAYVALTCTIAANGTFKVSRVSDPQTASAAASTDATAVSADITAALANVTISGDSTALGLVTQIQTDFNALTTALSPAAGAAQTLLVSYNPAAVPSQNQLKAMMHAIVQTVAGAKDLV